METECIPDQRDTLRQLGERLDGLESVLATDVILDDPTHGVVLEVVCDATRAGLPPRACQHIGDARATVVDVSPQGAPSHPIALVVVGR